MDNLKFAQHNTFGKLLKYLFRLKKSWHLWYVRFVFKCMHCYLNKHLTFISASRFFYSHFKRLNKGCDWVVHVLYSQCQDLPFLDRCNVVKCIAFITDAQNSDTRHWSPLIYDDDIWDQEAGKWGHLSVNIFNHLAATHVNSYTFVCIKWGWTIKKIKNKIKHLCKSLCNAIQMKFIQFKLKVIEYKWILS